MSITFNEIGQVKTPGVYCEIDNSLAIQGLTGKESCGLFIGRNLLTARPNSTRSTRYITAQRRQSSAASGRNFTGRPSNGLSLTRITL